MPTLKILQPGDEKLLEGFVLQHINTSMFLRSNLQAAGLVNGNQRYQAISYKSVEFIHRHFYVVEDMQNAC